MIEKKLSKIIDRWIDYLEIQKNYSSHTVNSYLSDLKFFLEYFSSPDISLSDLKKLEIRDFRNFFSHRAKDNIQKVSIAREESSIRNFFKWMNNNKIMKNTAIFQLSSPKLPKVLPRSVDVETIFDLIDLATENCSEPWI